MNTAWGAVKITIYEHNNNNFFFLKKRGLMMIPDFIYKHNDIAHAQIFMMTFIALEENFY